MKSTRAVSSGRSRVASRPREFLDRSAAWIAQRFDLTGGATVADYGCGPGLYARRFATAGARVTGVDFSSNSIAHARVEARRRGLDIEYVEANYLEYPPAGTFDLITLIYCDLCALSPAQRARLLKRFAGALADGGSVLLDVSTLPAFAHRVEPQRTRTVYNWLQYFTFEQLEAEFEAAGLHIVEKYGDVSGAPFGEEGEVMAVVAQRG